MAFLLVLFARYGGIESDIFFTRDIEGVGFAFLAVVVAAQPAGNDCDGKGEPLGSVDCHEIHRVEVAALGDKVPIGIVYIFRRVRKPLQVFNDFFQRYLVVVQVVENVGPNLLNLCESLQCGGRT